MNYCPDCASELILRVIEAEEIMTCPSCTFTNRKNLVPVVASILSYQEDIMLVRPNYMPESR